MSRTIDERIVQMTFNNQDFERRANATIATLGKLTTALNPSNLMGSLGGIQKISDNIDFSSITTSLTSISNGFNALEEIAVGALRRIGDAIASKVLAALNQVGNAIKSMTTGQISIGYQKYNDLTASVQTLVNSTGKSVEEIDEYLKRLMWYSDETSFGFTDMTKALGTMVSSGGEIDALIPLLMGVGNAVAYAGKGASEFTRVIYNLNQAYSMGKLTSMDWKSIENASVNSKELQKQLLGAAVALKKINSSQAKLENFKNLMQNGVFDRKVMEQAFGAFAAFTLKVEDAVNSGAYSTAAEAMKALSGTVEKYAEDAFIAAQTAKSFKEAIEATQDAVSSGWMQSFQLIFGDYNESKALWTDVTNTFWEIFASGAERRNTILESWKDIWKNKIDSSKINSAFDYEEWKKYQPYLTQTQALVGAISDAVLTIRQSVIDTFRSVFPIHTMLDSDGNIVEDYSATAKVIFNTVEKIRDFFISISANNDTSAFAIALRNNFRALLEVIQAISEYFSVFNSSFIKPLAEKLQPVAEELVKIFDNIGGIIFRTAGKAKSNMGLFETLLTNILNILDPVITLVKDALHWINTLLENVAGITIFDGIFSILNKGITFISGIIDGTIPILQNFGSILNTIFTSLEKGFSEFISANAAGLKDIAEGGLFAVISYGLASLTKRFNDFTGQGFSIANFFKQIKGVDIGQFFSSLKDGIAGLFQNERATASNISTLANALLKLALAMVVMSFVDGDKIFGILGAMFGVLVEVLSALAGLSLIQFKGPMGGMFNSTIKALKSITTSIILLSVALKILSSIDPIQMITSIVALGVTLLMLTKFIKSLANTATSMSIVGSGDSMKSISKLISKLGLALVEIAIALKIMSSIHGADIATSLVMMGVALAEIGAFVIAISKWATGNSAVKVAALGPTMLSIGLAVIEIAAALKLLSTIDAEGVDRSLVALLGALGTIGLFIVLVSNFTKGGSFGFAAMAAGMLLISVAIAAMTVSLLALSSMNWDSLQNGLLGLASLLMIVGVAGAIFGTISSVLLVGAATLAAFGVALYIVSAAMMSAVTAFTAFNMIGADFSKTIIVIMTNAFAALIGLIPSFILGVINAIIGIADEILDAITNLIKIVFDFLMENAANLASGLISFLTVVLEGLITGATTLIPVLFDLAMAILNGLNDGFIENYKTLVQNLFDLLLTVINGLADVIREGGGALGSALVNLVTALIEGALGALGSLGNGVFKVGSSIVDGFKDFWGNLFGDSETQDGGKDFVENIATGMDSSKDTVFNKSKEIGSGLMDSFTGSMKENAEEATSTADTIGTDAAEELEDYDTASWAGDQILSGFISAAKDNINLQNVYDAYSGVGKEAIRGIKDVGKISSPSKVAIKLGNYIAEGLIVGVREMARDIYQTGSNAGGIILEAISGASKIAEDILSEDLNPVITPVLDLSNIQNGADSISSLLNNSDLSMNLAAKAVRPTNTDQNSTSSVNPITINLTVNKAGGDISDFDMTRWGKQIAQMVNEELGGMLQ